MFLYDLHPLIHQLLPTSIVLSIHSLDFFMALQLMSSGLNNNTRCIMPPCPMEGNRAHLAQSNPHLNPPVKQMDLHFSSRVPKPTYHF